MRTDINELAEEYGGRLYALCLRLCGRKEPADELYQESWLRILERLDRYRPDRPFYPWAVKICVNLYRDGLRREKLRRVLPLEDPLPTAPGPDPDLKLDLDRAIGMLPEKYKLAVILVYCQDLPEKEAAALLRITLGGVKSRLSRAKKLLKEVLQDDG